MATGRDRKKFTKTGKAAEALALLDGVDMAFLTVDSCARVIYANRMAAEFFGQPEDMAESADACGG